MVDNSPGNDLASGTFTLSLDEPHSTVNHHAIAYYGHSTPSNPLNLSFSVLVSSNTSTTYQFQLTVLESSVIRELRFGLILIGNDGTGLIKAVTLVLMV